MEFPLLSVRELIETLTADEWRKQVSFSRDLYECSVALNSRSKSEAQKLDALSAWLRNGQPCIFGKIAAGRDLIEFCLLDEDDLSATDSEIQAKIQAARTKWKVAAWQGEKSGFVIVATSPRICEAQPDENLMNLAIRLFSLYLVEEEDIREDSVYQDNVFLYDYPPTRWGRAFGVGANFFGVQGDKRWWHDHRIPGGIGFSMNSPGHMVGAGEQRVRYLEGHKRALEEDGLSPQSKKLMALRRELEDLRKNNIDSLEQVLRYSMLTIMNASEQSDSQKGQTWQKATSLLRKERGSGCPFASIENDGKLGPFDCNTYLGWYHTDYSIPSDYFLGASPERPPELSPFALDFSYIHNPIESSFQHMSEGTRKKSPL